MIHMDVYVRGLFCPLAGKEKTESFDWRNSKVEHQPHLETFIIKKKPFLSYVQSLKDFRVKSFNTYYFTQNET